MIQKALGNFYCPTPEEIEAECRIIREAGWTDRNGRRRPPWSDEERRLRIFGRMLEQRAVCSQVEFGRIRTKAKISRLVRRAGLTVL